MNIYLIHTTTLIVITVPILQMEKLSHIEVSNLPKGRSLVGMV